MLSGSQIYPTLPAADIKRAARFYEDKLGLKKVDMPQPDGSAVYQAGDCSRFLVYETKAKPGEATAAFFLVDDLDREMSDLRSKGIDFEDYELEGLHTVQGVHSEEGMRAAWFKDSEGNTISLTEIAR